MVSGFEQCDIGDGACYAKAEGLRYVSDGKPGFTRKLRGKHFLFYGLNGKRITDEAEIKRIRRLAIPPAYRDVWICPYANGHLQATGIDTRGRKQYRYHPDWRKVRDASKFHRMLAFGEALPQMRAQVRQAMAGPELTREKVLATVVELLEKTKIRVGNEEYAKTNQSYGLTTLRDEHLALEKNAIRFRFMGKSGKAWNVKITDRRIAKILRECSEIEGQELFHYLDAAGQVHAVTSGDVNRYLKEISGEEFTAKDFRTWYGTVLAAMALEEYERFDSAAEAKKNVLTAIEHVAKELGNTPSVCRKCYIHPEIINAYLDGSFVKEAVREINATLKEKYERLSEEEIRVLQFLKKRLRAEARAA